MSPGKAPKERLLEKAAWEGDCLIWHGVMGSGGYGLFHFNGKNRSAHRVSYELHHGPIPPGLSIMHKCDNRRCINPAHLAPGTPVENMRDMITKGRDKKITGTQHKKSKLSPEIAAEIRRRFVPYDRINGSSALAREFGVTQGTVYTLLQGKTWK